MKLCRLLAFSLFVPASAVAQCVTGYHVIPECQLNPPVITSPLTLACDLHGDPCNYQITATTAPGTTIISYSALGIGRTDALPPGLVFDTSTGAMTGAFNPADGAGTYNIVIIATNGGGSSGGLSSGDVLAVTVTP